MSFNLLRDLSLILPLANRPKTEAGIIVPIADQTAPVIGMIVAVGPGYVDDDGVTITPPAPVGSVVVYMRNGSGIQPVSQDGDTLYIVPSTEILAIVEEREELC